MQIPWRLAHRALDMWQSAVSPNSSALCPSGSGTTDIEAGTAGSEKRAASPSDYDLPHDGRSLHQRPHYHHSDRHDEMKEQRHGDRTPADASSAVFVRTSRDDSLSSRVAMSSSA